jgi:hypothetical protein
MVAGEHDIDRAIAEQATGLPELRRPLARVPCDYRSLVVGRWCGPFEWLDPEWWARRAQRVGEFLKQTPSIDTPARPA